MNTLDVPIIDVSALFGSNEAAKTALAAELIRAASADGVFVVVGHQVSSSLTDSAFGKSQAFFHLPSKIKGQLSSRNSARTCGYFGHGEELSGHECFSDKKEGFDLSGRTVPGSESLGQGPSSEVFEEFKSSLVDYYNQLLGLSKALVAMFARGLGKEDNYFEQFLTEQNSQMRVLRYPAHQPGTPLEVGCGAHTDYGMLTLLCQNLPGVQTYSREGKWLDLNVPPEAFIVNVGDLMALWTNGKLHSNLHRVINRNAADRYALIFFLDPNRDARIEPFEAVLVDGEHVDSVPIVFHQYRKKILEATFI